MIGTRFDPDTLPPTPAAPRRLGNAILLTHLGYGHTSGSDPSACVDRAVTSYLVALSTPPRGTVCQADRLPSDPDFGKPVEPPARTGNTNISHAVNRLRIPG